METHVELLVLSETEEIGVPGDMQGTFLLSGMFITSLQLMYTYF